MADSEMTHHTHIDSELGGADHHLCRESQSFSDPDEGSNEGSCYSQFYSTYGDFSDGSRRVSSVATDCSVEINVLNGKKVERDCRICHLNVGDDGDAMELGCCCKDDLAVVHRLCAETWFKIKGNKTCEICNSIVSNLIGPNEIPPTRETTETNLVPTNEATTYVSATPNQSCINGHRFLNFILACMLFAFVVSWLFHFNIPS